MSKEKSNLLNSELSLIFLCVFLYLLGFGVLIPLLPVLSRELGASPLQLGILMSSYSLMQFLFSTFWGQLSDRYGRKPVLMICMLGEVISYAFFAFARSYESLLLARLMSGFFGASISTAAAAISDVTPENERSKGMALIGAAFGLGFIFGPALGGLITYVASQYSSESFFGSTVTMLCVSVICLINFVLVGWVLRETNKNLGQKTHSKLKVLALLEDIKKPLTGTLIWLALIMATAMAGMESTLALLVADRFNWGLFEVSLGFTYIGVLTTFNQGFLVRKLLPKVGERKLLVAGVLLMAASFGLTAFATQIWILAIAMTLLPFGSAFLNPSLMGSLSRLTSAKEQGRVLGSQQACGSLGRIIGPVTAGWMYKELGIQAPYLTAGFLSLVGALLVVRVWTKLPSGSTSGDIEALGIDHFQLDNLLQNRVRFLLLDWGSGIEKNLKGLALMHYNSIVRKQTSKSFDLKAFVAEFNGPISPMNNPKEQPVVLLGHQNIKKWAAQLSGQGFKNVCFLEDTKTI